MPLVAHSTLPTFQRLQEQGQHVLPLGHALHQDIRELHIGFLNLMPDAAFQATERQFLRLVGSSNEIAQYYIHPFTLSMPGRSSEIQNYINSYYGNVDDVKASGLDALIITGTNPTHNSLEDEPFWEPLGDVVEWAQESVTSVLCSCLAVHAIAQRFHHIQRKPLEAKRWGIYSHRITAPRHPLLRNMNTRFDVPHSRNNDVSEEQLKAAGFHTLVRGEHSGVHMAVSPDLFRIVFLQGHPEYDVNSLLKEYKREVGRFVNGTRDGYPRMPENYLNQEAQSILEAHKKRVLETQATQQPAPPFPEDHIEPLLENTWLDTGKSIFNNWLGLVYQLTNVDRHKAFIDTVSPDDPLGLREEFEKGV